MPTTQTISINLGTPFAGLDLAAQLIKSDGTNITSLITDGFVEIGEGFYIWEYTNFPTNFRGGVKFYDQADTSKVISFIDTESLSTACGCNEACVTDFDTKFEITYEDQPSLTFYAVLFSAQEPSKAWKVSTGTFETYTLAAQSSFVIPLAEDSQRIGWYSYTINDLTNIPIVVGSEYYSIEVWRQKGASPSRNIDCLAGTLKVCWGKANSEFLEIAKKVWEYGTRTLTSSAITPQQIWEYTSRTLTAGGVVDCDFTQLEQHILAAILVSTGKTLDELTRVDQELGASIDKTFELLKTCCAAKTHNLPNVQTPRIGPRGSRGGNPGIKFG